MSFMREYYKKVENVLPKLNGWISVRLVRKKLGIASSNRSHCAIIQGILKRMEEEGKIERLSRQNRRATVYKIIEVGT